MDHHLPSSESHQQIAQLIPWLVNGTLAAADAAGVRAHLEECAECRKDHDAQRRWQESMCEEGSLVFAAEPSFQKLMSRLEAGAAVHLEELPGAMGAAGDGVVPVAKGPPATTASSRWTPRWLAAAVVLEAIALGVGGWAWHGQVSRTAAPYATLTSALPSYATGPRVRVVFRSDLSLGLLKGLLQSVGAHVVDGPTEANVYTLGFAQPLPDSGQLQARITTLRANPSVLFAEPADSTDGSP
ncbi:MAG TPA: zf-HC2 domain-containing protein [Steroidobacteraceae bacterium]